MKTIYEGDSSSLDEYLTKNGYVYFIDDDNDLVLVKDNNVVFSYTPRKKCSPNKLKYECSKVLFNYIISEFTKIKRKELECKMNLEIFEFEQSLIKDLIKEVKIMSELEKFRHEEDWKRTLDIEGVMECHRGITC